MKNASTELATIGVIALFALAAAVPASADPGRYHWRHYSYDHRRDQSHDYLRHHRNRPKIVFGIRPDRHFGLRRDRYFGVGPGSYECYGYDCNW